MFGWFRPTCPVDMAAKNWVEERLLWLSEQFGLDVFTRRAVILPTEDFFPDPYDASNESVRTLLNRVCLYMDVDPKLVELEIFKANTGLWLVNEKGQALPTHAAGLYEERGYQTVIHMEESEIFEPMDIVGTMAHELSHLRLIGEGRIDPECYDNELLTDLTAVFHGFGIFLANSPRHWDSDFSIWPGTDLKKPEYMTLPMFGYALAHTAWFRDDLKPEWFSHLRHEARANVKQGLRYLQNTGDSSFKPNHGKTI